MIFVLLSPINDESYCIILSSSSFNIYTCDDKFKLCNSFLLRFNDMYSLDKNFRFLFNPMNPENQEILISKDGQNV